ncbi:MAG: Rid family hydrolase [Phycisphaerales bacterium]|jgi:enamine deaminase RidA (YjgF/YER057c/UK114 family)|nr:Rid family hydrolase [Phycisphaerales bacterium]
MPTPSQSTLVTQPDGRRRLETPSPWEPRMGYSRAVQAGPMIWVSGCVGTNPDGTYPPDLAGQTRRCVERIGDALAALDASLAQIVKVRIHVTDISRWEEVASIMGPTFADIRPANVMVEVAGLVDEAMVEIEAEAWVG